MPRPRKVIVLPMLAAGQAAYVVERLIQDRRLSPREVSGYLSAMVAEIQDLEARIAALKSAVGSTPAAAPVRRGPGRPRGSRSARPQSAASRQASLSDAPAVAPSRKRRRITPAQRSARQLQGRYIGYLRQIPASRRGHYQRIAAEQGRDAAVAALRVDLKK
jgi:hypothetical protein